MSSKIYYWFFGLLILGFLIWIFYLLFYSPTLISLPLVQRLREGFVGIKEGGVRLATRTGDYTYYPKEISIDSNLPDGEFVYYFPSKYVNIDFGEKTITVADENNTNYRFPITSISDIDESSYRVIFNHLDIKNNVWVNENLRVFKGTEDVQQFKDRLHNSKYIILTWTDRKSLDSFKQSIQKYTSSNELIPISTVAFSIIE